MKIIRITLIYVAIIISIISCKKEEKTESPSIDLQQNNRITQQLKYFKLTLNLKSTVSIPTDSAEWYLEGLLNYENANNDHAIKNLEFFKDSLVVITEDGNISIEQLDIAYNYFTQKLSDALGAKNDSSFMMDMIDLSIKDSQLKNTGTKTIQMTGSLGLHYIGSYVAFEFTDYWRWGWDMGKCGSYSGGDGQDAADKLEYRFNHPNYSLGVGHYLTDVEVVAATPFDYYDPDYIGPFQPNMIFLASGQGENPLVEPCLSPSNLNYYLSKFDYIMNDKKPTGKTFKSVDVTDDFFSSINTWTRLHDYYLYYATYVSDPIGH